jgi:DGQHR domain-containing protein
MAELKVSVFPVRQPIGTYFIGVLSHVDLIKISSSDIRRLRDSDLDDYMGIQRRLDPSRMKDINAYVGSFDASFPTAVLLAVDDKNAFIDEENHVLCLYDEGDDDLGEIATIIDGQHRIEGLKAFKGERFDVPVCFFIGADKHLQSTIFATVNLAQTKVNRSLAYDLLDYEKLESPQKVAHWIAVNLDRMQESPFRDRIKRLGVATEGRSRETLTQATIVEMLVNLFLSAEPTRDRNSLWSRLNRSELPDARSYPFRDLYRQSKDEDILANLINYFSAVSRRYPESWSDSTRRGNILPKTNGFRALMRALRDVYPALAKATGKAVLNESDYSQFVNQIPLEDGDFTVQNFPAGTSGEVALYNKLKEAIASIQP